MALKKSLNTKYDVNADYWKITHIRANYMTGTCEIVLSGYLNQEAREDMKSPLEAFTYYMDIGTGDLRQDAYTYIKSAVAVDFSDAEDV